MEKAKIKIAKDINMSKDLRRDTPPKDRPMIHGSSFYMLKDKPFGKAQDKPVKECKCHCHSEYPGVGICGCCKNNHPHPTDMFKPVKVEGWYWKLFDTDRDLFFKIKSLLSSEKSRWLAEIKRKLPKRKRYQKPLAKNVLNRKYDCDVTNFNEAIDQLLQILKEYENKTR